MRWVRELLLSVLESFLEVVLELAKELVTL